MEAKLKRLKDEIAAQKVVFEKMALQMPVFTKSLDFTTKANSVTIKFTSESNPYTSEGAERVVVTFTTTRGVNTLATLEIKADGNIAIFKTRRIPYAGGARWIVYALPNYSNGARVDRHYTFTIQSAVDGTLGAKMIWQ